MTKPTKRPPVPAKTCADPAVQAQILSGLRAGDSLPKICRRAGMPGLRTVYDELARNPSFREDYQHARIDQQHALVDQMLDIADRATDATAKAARLQIWTRQWTAAKLNPKKYGLAVQMQHSGAVGTFDATRYTDDQLTTLLSVLGADAAPEQDGGSDQGGVGEEEG